MQPSQFQQRLFELAAEYENLHAAAFQARRGSGCSSAAVRLSGTSNPDAPPEGPEALADPADDGVVAGPSCNGERAQQPGSGFPVRPAAVSLVLDQTTPRHIGDQTTPRASRPSRVSSSLSMDASSTDITGSPRKASRRLQNLREGTGDISKFNSSRSFGRLSKASFSSLTLDRRNLSWFVRSRYFNASFALLIIVSTLLIGIETQVMCSMSGQGSGSERVFFILSVTNYVCTFLFTLEIVARLYVFRSDFFVYEKVWNFCDVIILLLALVEVAMELSVGRNLDSGKAKMLRMLRLSRLLRLVRTFRHLKPLRMLVHSITFAAKSVFWAIMLLVMIVYAFGVILTQGVMEHTEGGTRIEDEDLMSYYGDLYRSMLSLWMAVSGGISWIELTDPLERTGNSTWMMLFLVYIAFVYFFILNVVTGVFCQNAIEGARQDLDLTIDAQLKEKKQHVDRLGVLFQEMNADSDALDDGLTAQELHFQLSKPKVQAWFKTLDVDAKQTWKLFKMIDSDQSGRVSLEEFVVGCLRLRGSATRVDVESLKWEIRRANSGVVQAAERIAWMAEDVRELRRASGVFQQ